MHTLVRRFAVLAVLMFWQGGFTFYAAIVVPRGQEILGPSQQADVTRQVTNYLNVSGGVGLVILAWELLAQPRRTKVSGRISWGAWAGMLLTLLSMVWLHPRLEKLMDAERFDHDTFHPSHRIYLWLSTLQWFFCLVYMTGILRTWPDVAGLESKEMLEKRA